MESNSDIKRDRALTCNYSANPKNNAKRGHVPRTPLTEPPRTGSPMETDEDCGCGRRLQEEGAVGSDRQRARGLLLGW